MFCSQTGKVIQPLSFSQRTIAPVYSDTEEHQTQIRRDGKQEKPEKSEVNLTAIRNDYT